MRGRDEGDKWNFTLEVKKDAKYGRKIFRQLIRSRKGEKILTELKQLLQKRKNGPMTSSRRNGLFLDF